MFVLGPYCCVWENAADLLPGGGKRIITVHFFFKKTGELRLVLQTDEMVSLPSRTRGAKDRMANSSLAVDMPACQGVATECSLKQEEQAAELFDRASYKGHQTCYVTRSTFTVQMILQTLVWGESWTSHQNIFSLCLLCAASLSISCLDLTSLLRLSEYGSGCSPNKNWILASNRGFPIRFGGPVLTAACQFGCCTKPAGTKGKASLWLVHNPPRDGLEGLSEPSQLTPTLALFDATFGATQVLYPGQNTFSNATQWGKPSTWKRLSTGR